jgi:hypothetical protein
MGFLILIINGENKMGKRGHSSFNYFRKIGHIFGILLVLLFIVAVNILVHPVDKVAAHLGQAGNTKPCLDCHSTSTTTSGANIYAVINANQGTSITLDNSVQQTFEVDYYFTALTGSKLTNGVMVNLPATTWFVSSNTTLTPSLSNDPTYGGWHSSWDTSGGGTWNVQTNTNLDWTINYQGTSWDQESADQENTACNNGGFCEGTTSGFHEDLDGVANKHGTDLLITIPQGFTPGNYTVTLYGIGFDGNKKAHISTTLSVEVTSSDADPPTGFTGIGSATDAATDGEVNLSWSNAGVSDASPPVTYNIYWSTTTPITDFTTPNATVGGTSYTASGLTNNTLYYFVVRARDNIGNEETNTNEASATPTDTTPPTGFTGIGSASNAATDGEVNLTWSNAGVTDNSPPVTYNIYWSTTTPITDQPPAVPATLPQD